MMILLDFLQQIEKRDHDDSVKTSAGSKSRDKASNRTLEMIPFLEPSSSRDRKAPSPIRTRSVRDQEHGAQSTHPHRLETCLVGNRRLALDAEKTSSSCEEETNSGLSKPPYWRKHLQACAVDRDELTNWSSRRLLHQLRRSARHMGRIFTSDLSSRANCNKTGLNHNSRRKRVPPKNLHVETTAEWGLAAEEETLWGSVDGTHEIAVSCTTALVARSRFSDLMRRARVACEMSKQETESQKGSTTVSTDWSPPLVDVKGSCMELSLRNLRGDSWLSMPNAVAAEMYPQGKEPSKDGILEAMVCFVINGQVLPYLSPVTVRPITMYTMCMPGSRRYEISGLQQALRDFSSGDCRSITVNGWRALAPGLLTASVVVSSLIKPWQVDHPQVHQETHLNTWMREGVNKRKRARSEVMRVDVHGIPDKAAATAMHSLKTRDNSFTPAKSKERHTAENAHEGHNEGNRLRLRHLSATTADAGTTSESDVHPAGALMAPVKDQLRPTYDFPNSIRLAKDVIRKPEPAFEEEQIFQVFEGRHGNSVPELQHILHPEEKEDCPSPIMLQSPLSDERQGYPVTGMLRIPGFEEEQEYPVSETQPILSSEEDQDSPVPNVPCSPALEEGQDYPVPEVLCSCTPGEVSVPVVKNCRDSSYDYSQGILPIISGEVIHDISTISGEVIHDISTMTEEEGMVHRTVLTHCEGATMVDVSFAVEVPSVITHEEPTQMEVPSVITHAEPAQMEVPSVITHAEPAQMEVPSVITHAEPAQMEVPSVITHAEPTQMEVPSVITNAEPAQNLCLHTGPEVKHIGPCISSSSPQAASCVICYDGSPKPPQTAPNLGYGIHNVPAVSRMSSRHVRQDTAKPGLTVRRGRDWQWGEQDGGDGALGVLEGPANFEGYYRVKWLKGGVDVYRVGAEGRYDLEFLPCCVGEI
ncbi:hypothetical protein CEUSTIGMA_g3634.t1 [Chlamydomonas eustigma]|uniref:MIB/HERC2 domain-containing protein n=1 Tax=Chlamydomonas eustigma TaxID=1157962 RepID=A0A250X0A3_9CHLO|nr:hypothetical protein CEUSTIGMA_g3634.t1 [Chlamydomonas eustigma]|eukprot:GAX76190.1 hypothetical protein CEUSTIGMA_g3634.t1 [Chlamydomonas eustigma]